MNRPSLPRPRIGRFEMKIAVAVAVAAVVPLAAGALLIGRVVDETLSVGLNEDVASHLQASTRLYPEFFHAMRGLQDARGSALAHAVEHVLPADSAGDAQRLDVERVLRDFVAGDEDIIEATVLRPNGEPLATATAAPPELDMRSRELALALHNSGTLRVTFVLSAAYFSEFRYAEETLLPVYAELQSTQARLRYFYTLFYVVILLMVLTLSVAMGLIVARSVTRRVHALLPATERVAGGDLSVEVPTEARDEVGDLTRAFNRMVQQLRASRERIAYLQKMGAWEEIARRLAHEIKNPLTPIQLAVQELHRKYPGGNEAFGKLLEEVVEVIEEEVAALRTLVEAFADFARLPRVDPRPDDLVSFARDFVASCPPFGEAIDLVLGDEASLPDEVPALMDRMMLRRALLNLVKNAAEAMEGRGRVTVRLGVEEGRPWVSVSDEGPGIDAADRKRVFEPNFTTKNEGTGLGLAIVRRIVLEHRGDASVHAGPEGGTEMRLTLQPPALTAS